MKSNQNMIEDIFNIGKSILMNALASPEGLGKQARKKADVIIDKLDLVTRDEFEALLAMISKARSKQDDLDDRLSLVEAKLNLSRSGKTKSKVKTRLPSVKQSKPKKKRG
ncbi:MAG: accessory factor UbiK family protein [Alphaproteobacteria bacterium]|nr:accessory factor UbiK family protein [Alphaproteobacteria bacterium]